MMVLLNRKIDYSLLILCYLHHRPVGGCARAIADHFRISRPFVANILKDLCQKAFVRSQRGVKGGYVLHPGVQERTLADLMDSMDDKVRLVECMDVSQDCCSLEAMCPIRAPILDVHLRLRSVLESVKLIEIFQRSTVSAENVPLETSRCTVPACRT
jgi:Rrf2 family protein